MACNCKGTSRILTRFDVEKLGQISQLKPSNLIGKACDENASYRAYRKHFWHKVDFTATLWLVCFPENYLVLGVAEVAANAH